MINSLSFFLRSSEDDLWNYVELLEFYRITKQPYRRLLVCWLTQNQTSTSVDIYCSNDIQLWKVQKLIFCWFPMDSMTAIQKEAISFIFVCSSKKNLGSHTWIDVLCAQCHVLPVIAVMSSCVWDIPTCRRLAALAASLGQSTHNKHTSPYNNTEHTARRLNFQPSSSILHPPSSNHHMPSDRPDQSLVFVRHVRTLLFVYVNTAHI